MPLTKRMMFAPASMTDRFKAEYSTGMAMRPSQIRATVVDGALMMPCAAGLRPHYHELRMPVVIMAGAGDLVVSSRHAERLHEAIPGSALQIVPGIGHMVHHVASTQAAQAVADMSSRSQEKIPASQPTGFAPPDTGLRSPSLTRI
jgi:pimeloyl-ACP methyl ester carboxylesterase